MIKWFIVGIVFCWAACAVAGAAICHFIGQDAVTAYGSIKVVSPSALFALSAVVFSWRATWLPKLQEAYEGAIQKDHVLELRERGIKAEHYGGFLRLSRALDTLTGIIPASAFLQIFLGLWPSPYAAGLSLGMTVGVLILFAFMHRVMARIERARIRKFQEEAEAKHPGPAHVVV